MSALADRLRSEIRKFDSEVMYWLEGTAAIMHVAGHGSKLNTFRRGREYNRPPAVTLEVKSDRQFMVGLVISRPKNGKLVYDQVLGHWDLGVPIHPDGPLNENNPQHRRVAAWGLQLLKALLQTANALRKGAALDSAMAMPRVFVPFSSGEERINTKAHADFPDAVVDCQTIPGQTLVESRIAYATDVARAIDNDTALEDFRPVLGQYIPNPFRFVSQIKLADGAQTFAVKKIQAGAPSDVFHSARRFIGRAYESGATDEDIVTAAQNLQQDLYLSLFSKIQVVPVETLVELPAPYAGLALPPIAWRKHKNQMLVDA